MCVVPLFTCLMTGHIPQLVIVSVFIGLLIMNIVIILVHVGSNEMAVPPTAKRVKHWSPRGTLPFSRRIVMDHGKKLQSWPELEAYL